MEKKQERSNDKHDLRETERKIIIFLGFFIIFFFLVI